MIRRLASGLMFSLVLGLAPVSRADGPCAADLDGDGVVGPVDLADLLQSWGPNPGDPADLTGDGVIDATPKEV